MGRARQEAACHVPRAFGCHPVDGLRLRSEAASRHPALCEGGASAALQNRETQMPQTYTVHHLQQHHALVTAARAKTQSLQATYFALPDGPQQTATSQELAQARFEQERRTAKYLSLFAAAK
jgi:hypothetical protein